ncbi:MerR family transcriptional regulator [Nonomuraea candida]|uniref:MerR family transcriptional regulator n=1 Tax=Nonomuraea candida TaxID=359159 RepID=UPI001FE0C24F|nr:MerR family transcriptional regulator [Nonomuraea candida]
MGAERSRLRPVDLARLAGVSTQQIRNYVDAGILPPAGRTETGYRTFGAHHRAALLAYRAMLKGYGAEAARSIMLAVHDGDRARAFALVDACHAALHEQRASLRTTAETLDAIAGQIAGAPEAPRADLRIGEVAAHLGVRASALRVWEHAGLLAPRREPGTGYRVYGPSDVREARVVHVLRQGRHPLPQIRLILDGLRRTGDTTALRAAVAERLAGLTRTGEAMLDAAVHLRAYLSGHVS